MKKMAKYILICLPFISGGLLFSFGVINLFSSVLFFCGGYVALKKILNDKKREINGVKDKEIMFGINNSYKKDYSYRSAENIVGFKKTMRGPKVRKRVK